MKYFLLSDFYHYFPDDDSCLEEIKRLKFPRGIFCDKCNKVTIHYRVKNRTAYSCKLCRSQIFPLKGTIFEKTATPLRTWFFACYLMTFTRATISIRALQQELAVTYKTAWRMYTSIKELMAQNNGDLLHGPAENVLKWTIFNKFEIRVVEKKESHEDK